MDVNVTAVDPLVVDQLVDALFLEFSPYFGELLGYGYLLVTFWIPGILVVGCLWWFFRQFISSR